MNCSSSFVFDFKNQFDDSSQVYEIFITNECISNTFKGVVFLLSTLLYGSIWLLSDYLLIKDFIDRRTGTCLRKLVYLTVWLGSLTSTVLYIMFLTGSHSLMRYIVSAVPNMTQRAYGTLMSLAWFETVRNIDRNQYDRLRLPFRICVHTFDLLIVIVNVVYVVGMVTNQGEPGLVNRYFVFHIMSVSLLSILSCLCSIIIGKRLIKLCKPDPEAVAISSVLVEKFCQQVSKTIRYFISMIILQIPLVLLPIWLIYDLHYYYYVYFTVVSLMLASAYLDSLRVVQKNSDSSKGGSGDNDNGGNGGNGKSTKHPVIEVDNQEHNHFSFTVEQLTVSANS